MSIRQRLPYILIAFFFAAFFWNGYLSLRAIYDHEMGRNTYTTIQHDALKGRDPPESLCENMAQETASDLQNLPDINETTLIQINPDYAAWILIPDTQVQYPVVYPTNNTTYLTKTFDGKKHSCGCLFFESREIPFSTPNTVIHGHNMKAGDMFGGLKQYLSEEYARAHSNLFLYKDGSWIRYQLYSVYVTDESDPFPYQNYFPQKGDYEQYLVSSYKKSRVNNTGLIRNEKLLTLSTCHGTAQKLIVQWYLSGSDYMGG